jgi:hypothetical protein
LAEALVAKVFDMIEAFYVKEHRALLARPADFGG